MTKILEFQLQHQSFQRVIRLISLKIDWLDLFAVQGSLRSLLHSTTVQRHQFFGALPSYMVQLSHPYMTPGKTITLTRWTFVSKVTSLLSTHCLVCHHFPAKKKPSSDFTAAVTIHSGFRAQEEEICHCFHFFPFCLP